jgi:hypothetical protein
MTAGPLTLSPRDGAVRVVISGFRANRRALMCGGGAAAVVDAANRAATLVATTIVATTTVDAQAIARVDIYRAAVVGVAVPRVGTSNTHSIALRSGGFWISGTSAE